MAEHVRVVFNDLYPSQDGTIQIVFDLKRRLSTEELQNLYDHKGSDLSLNWTLFKERRSLNANAYFHVLVERLSDKIGISKIRAKNMMLERYGQKLYLQDGDIAVIKTNIPPEVAYEDPINHLSPIASKTENDKDVTFYTILRGSHTYNMSEMSYLINGVVSECKDQGIETLPPEELERMIEKWKPRKAAGHEE